MRCARIIRQYVKTPEIDILRFFRVLLFNFITLNDDAHLKNFTLTDHGDEYHLSPAYDLVNTSLHIRQPRIFAREGAFQRGHEDRRHTSGLGQGIQGAWQTHRTPLTLVDREIARFSAHNDKADALIGRSFLSPELKETYLCGYHYRQSMLRPD